MRYTFRWKVIYHLVCFWKHRNGTQIYSNENRRGSHTQAMCMLWLLKATIQHSLKIRGQFVVFHWWYRWPVCLREGESRQLCINQSQHKYDHFRLRTSDLLPLPTSDKTLMVDTTAQNLLAYESLIQEWSRSSPHPSACSLCEWDPAKLSDVVSQPAHAIGCSLHAWVLREAVRPR